MSKPTLSDVLEAEIRDLVVKGKEINDKLVSAKTKPKKELYTKKLEKVKADLRDMLVAYDRLQKKKESEVALPRSEQFELEYK